MFKVPTEKYEKYRYLFDNEDFSCTWVESAFEPKSAGLLVDEEKNPTVAILHYP
ncbi:MAG: hypothetical protein NWE77_08020 [Candidatus Bathyarchaeota archaeon]|nr:hypothetical protein [Candidatus Bathyarchaeota archaeon]